MKKTVLATTMSAALMAASGSAQAYLIFFGEDLNNSSTIPLASIPNSSAAETGFLSNLVGVGTEDFESQTVGSTTPLNLVFPGAGTATLSGGDGVVASTTPGTTNGAGRYSIPSASSSNWWDVVAGGTGNFQVDIDSTVAAFGFYGIDIGDYGGQLQLSLSNGDLLTVPNTIGSGGSTDGSVLYYGIIAENAAEEFNSVSFLMTGGVTTDVFAFDNFTIGSRQQVVPTPEPGILGLLGLGLAALGFKRKNRKV